ncbi:MAG: enoyl-ACP reductase FabI [Rhodospirillaceae bacterium]|nr:enoyl-ACP reductase FabI [Rhodospirillaceae bacterium]
MSGQPGFLSGRRGLVMGVANDRSIAWGIARQASKQGAELAFTYQGDALEKRVRPLAESVNANIIAPCDVTDPDSIDSLFEQVGNTWGKIDFVIHAVAFSDKAELNGRYADTSRENFLRTMDISCFSFTDVCRRASALMPDGGSLLTLSYYGAERVVPHYNVMGVAKAALEASVRYLATDLGRDNIRVNAMSAGPMKTLAASGIGDFRYILKWNELNAPMHRNVTLDDVGRSGLYLISDLSSGVTGEVHHVDCGYHVVGMMAPESAQDIADLLDGANLKD